MPSRAQNWQVSMCRGSEREREKKRKQEKVANFLLSKICFVKTASKLYFACSTQEEMWQVLVCRLPEHNMGGILLYQTIPQHTPRRNSHGRVRTCALSLCTRHNSRVSSSDTSFKMSLILDISSFLATRLALKSSSCAKSLEI